jgi:hypothetical protein
VYEFIIRYGRYVTCVDHQESLGQLLIRLQRGSDDDFLCGRQALNTALLREQKRHRFCHYRDVYRLNLKNAGLPLLNKPIREQPHKLETSAATDVWVVAPLHQGSYLHFSIMVLIVVDGHCAKQGYLLTPLIVCTGRLTLLQPKPNKTKVDHHIRPILTGRPVHQPHIVTPCSLHSI